MHFFHYMSVTFIRIIFHLHIKIRKSVSSINLLFLLKTIHIAYSRFFYEKKCGIYFTDFFICKSCALLKSATSCKFSKVISFTCEHKQNIFHEKVHMRNYFKTTMQNQIGIDNKTPTGCTHLTRIVRYIIKITYTCMVTLKASILEIFLLEE